MVALCAALLVSGGAARASGLPDTIRTAGFSVRPPAGAAWRVQVDSTHEVVRFSTQRRWLLNTVQVDTIAVFPIAVPDTTSGTEEQIAGHVFDGREQGMNDAVKANKLKLMALSRSTADVAGRRVFAQTYEENNANWFLHGRLARQGTYRLWFPPDFASTHRLMAFAMWSEYQRDNLRVKVDLSQLDPVIASCALSPAKP
jgi:hypothetical protein